MRSSIKPNKYYYGIDYSKLISFLKDKYYVEQYSANIYFIKNHSSEYGFERFCKLLLINENDKSDTAELIMDIESAVKKEYPEFEYNVV
jgi:hypothetical protein